MSTKETTTGTVNAKPRYPINEITLKRSKIKVGVPEDWHVQDTIAAQRYGKGDSGKTNLALVQRTCLFDGAKWTITDIEEKVSGKDWIQLQGELFGDDEDEDDAGNA